MKTADLPRASAVPLWNTAKSRKTRAKVYTTKSTGTKSRNPWLMWLAARATGFSISGPDKRLSEITALNAFEEKPNKQAYENARAVLHLAELFDIDPTNVTASAEGGVALCFKVDGMYADIECFNSGEMWAIISDRVNPASTWPVKNSPAGIGAALLKIKSQLNA